MVKVVYVGYSDEYDVWIEARGGCCDYGRK